MSCEREFAKGGCTQACCVPAKKPESDAEEDKSEGMGRAPPHTKAELESMASGALKALCKALPIGYIYLAWLVEGVSLKALCKALPIGYIYLAWLVEGVSLKTIPLFRPCPLVSGTWRLGSQHVRKVRTGASFGLTVRRQHPHSTEAAS